MDALLQRRSLSWPGRDAFIARNFHPYLRLGLDPAAAYFIDGSVLNNRPFRQAIAAVHQRPAYRQVDRRVVYIDPDPALPGARRRHAPPGFFAVLKGALSDLPSIEPVTDELKWVDEFNDRVVRLREIIDDARPSISRRVADIIEPDGEPPSAERVRHWRERANGRAASDAGFAYEGYVRLKLASVRDFVAGLVARLTGVPARSPQARAAAAIVGAWAMASGCVYDGGATPDVHLDHAEIGPHSPPWVRFLFAFDIDYRKRRLHFMIEGQNRLYQKIQESRLGDFDVAGIDRLKRKFYDQIDLLSHCEAAALAEAPLAEAAQALFPQALSADDAKDLEAYAQRFVARNRSALDRLVWRMAAAIDLEASTNDIELLLADPALQQWPAEVRRELFVNYLGFPFWDVLTFPVMRWREVGELNKILIDRISPADARIFAGCPGAATLKGSGFSHFAAFFSRAYRENDYLLGRLHALDRLVDIVCDAAGGDIAPDAPAVLAIKKRGFLTILDAEQHRLPAAAPLIAALRCYVEGLAPSSGPPDGTPPHRSPSHRTERTAASPA